MPKWFRISLYLAGFVIGTVLMGFEMLGSRYLNPYFGSGIGTWASLISVVLAAMMLGYFLGGNIVDRKPHAHVLGYVILGAGVYLFFVPFFIDALMNFLIMSVGDGPAGVLSSSIVLLLVPVTLMGTFSPFGVRLLIKHTSEGGRVSGRVYGISTIGNVVGTLGVTFFLIPEFGTRAITYFFGLVLLACALYLIACKRYTAANP